MYKVIIADDERIVLEGLKNTFDWRNFGFEVCGLAENGKEALEILEKTKSHVVITDIKMPDLDGLELTRIIKERHPLTHVIIISAYNDFEYAQKAIKYGANGYLLKPLKEIELSELISKVKAELELLEFIKLNGTTSLNKTILNSISKEVILKKLLDGELNGNFAIEKYLDKYDLKFLKKPIRIALCNIEFKEKFAEGIFMKSAINIGLLCLEKMGIPAIEHLGFIIMFLCGSNKIHKNKMLNILTNYKNFFEKELKKLGAAEYSITIGVSNLCNKWTQLSTLFNEALCSYKYKYFLGSDRIIFYDELKLKNYLELRGEKFNNIVDKIINTIFIGEVKQLIKEVDNFFNCIDEQGNFTAEDINTKIIEVLFDIIHAVKVATIATENFSSDGDIINEIQRITSYENLKTWFKDKIISLYEKSRICSCNRSNWVVQKAMYYIKANIYKKITLEEVADYLHVNPSYLSATFKRSIGKNFIDFVTESKIEEAKYLLLNSNLKIIDISHKLGYNDYSYFCRTFRKIEEMTPLEFRIKGIQNNR